jgi:methylenetetrahydrofolate reductase (NADPH)
MRVNLELVPRDEATVLAQLAEAAPFALSIEAVNLPDLTRFSLRSWDAAPLVTGYAHSGAKPFPRVIPHLRAIDFDPRGLEDGLFAMLERTGLAEVLVVTGDPPRDLSRPVYPTRASELIRELKASLPSLRCYAGFDPYRNGPREELRLVEEKLRAGCDGLFSQPFFDCRLLEAYGDQLAGLPVWWGLCPVIGERSMRYWATTNKAIFPRDFEPSLDGAVELFGRVAKYAESSGSGIYLMPIKIPLAEYLGRILGRA